ncbi:MAG: two pore domain potassium channel family protein [Hyphomonadaceae bacterium]|nr:two pore domain potassium channel family protein [Hyphomonadaceae bacterium]MBX3511765.1 two pore domain potassium channel family protein [Hyphomonadaceae bacterium]
MGSSLSQLALNLGVATVMVALTTLTHFFGLLVLTRLMSGVHGRLRPHEAAWRQAGMILLVVFGIFALHTAEVWSYAVLYRLLGEFTTFEPALYFSTVSFSTLGLGDLTLGANWRLLGAIEAVNGLVLIAWSTAFLMSVTARLRLLEHEWLERPDDGRR